MITCKLKRCGLGSQLFQIAATLALAWDNNDEATFNFIEQLQPTQGHRAIHYTDTIYRGLWMNTGFTPSQTYREPSHSFSPIPYSPFLEIEGFFQSEKYFKHHRDKLLKKFKSSFPYYPDERVAIHVRRGDYLKVSDYHPVCDLDYYQRAIDMFPADTKFLVFSDDIDWCEQSFEGKRFTHYQAIGLISGLGDLDDFYLMSSCHHQIISNSTFSWWASWLNTNPDKRIIAPKQWFGKQCKSIVTDDIYTPEMTIT
jgi:hypothetical protein